MSAFTRAELLNIVTNGTGVQEGFEIHEREINRAYTAIDTIQSAITTIQGDIVAIQGDVDVLESAAATLLWYIQNGYYGTGGGYTGISLQMTRPNDNEESNQLRFVANKGITIITVMVPPCLPINLWVMKYTGTTWSKIADFTTTGNTAYAISSSLFAAGDLVYFKINGASNNIPWITVELV